MLVALTNATSVIPDLVSVEVRLTFDVQAKCKSASFIAYIKYMKQKNMKQKRNTKVLEYSSTNMMPAAGTTALQ